MIARIRMFPDDSENPLWADDGQADLEGLGLSDSLVCSLRDWSRRWEELLGVGEGRFEVVDRQAYAAWARHGRDLARWVQAELGPDIRVEYQP